MGGASSYIAMLCIAGFLGATWTASKVSRLLGVSDIVLVITTGVVLGPDILGLVAKEYSVCSEARHADCSTVEDVTYKMANNMPLGQALGRIQNMDACDPADYHHDDHESVGDGHGHGEDASHGTMPGAANETHGGEHAADDGHATDGAAHEDSSEHHSTGGEHSAGDHSAGGGHSTAGDHSTSGEHSTSGTDSDGHSSPADHSGGEHGAAADHDAHQVSHGSGHRRLSGGSGSYTSYEECLVKTCDADISHECQLTPDVFTLIGHAGVALMIFESGMHFDFEKAKVVGPKACVVAVIGTVLPLVTGAALTMVYGKPFFPHGISAGTALAPTSVGIALRLLGEAGVLQENFGQAIITAAFVDDILSLVLFNVLFSLGGEFDIMAVVVNPCIGVAVMLFAMYLAMKFWPKFINEWLLPKVPVKEGAKVPQTDEVLFLLMIFLLIGYGTITYFLGTHLWGCFIAGMSFACLSPPHHAHHLRLGQADEASDILDDQNLFCMHRRLLHPDLEAPVSRSGLERCPHGHRPLHPYEGLLCALHGRGAMGHWLGHGRSSRVRILDCTNGRSCQHAGQGHVLHRHLGSAMGNRFRSVHFPVCVESLRSSSRFGRQRTKSRIRGG